MAAAVQPRADFLGDDLRRTARKSEEADQTRQLLALTVILDGGSRREAARTGGGGLQVIRDRVLRFKAGGAEALVTRKAPAKTPILTDEHRTALAATVEAGPKPDMDGIVRWRRVDPAQGAQEEPGVPVSRQSSDAGTGPSRPGVRHGVRQALRPPAARRTARRGHRGVQQNSCDVVDHIRTQCGGKPIELRVQGDARMGQKNKRTRRRARRGTRPRAPHDQRTEGAYLFGALCPAKGAGRVMPWCDTRPMAEPLKLIGQQGDAGAHALLILDRAGGQTLTQMGCPRQHHPRPTAAKGTRGEPGRERLAVHPGHLAFDPRFQDLRRHRSSLLPSLEHPQASTRARHLNRRARRGPSGGIIERWYKRQKSPR